MLQFRPDIKPPMWGAPDAVLFAVRANCERLGLPAPMCFSPFWGKDFGELFVGSTVFDSQGVAVVGTTASSNVRIPIPVVTLTELYAFYSGETKQSAVGFFGTVTNTNLLRCQRLGVNAYRLYGNTAYLSGASIAIVEPAEKTQATWSAGWSAPGLKNETRFSIKDVSLFRTGKSTASASVPSITIPSGELFRMVWDSKHRFFAFWDTYPDSGVDEMLHYEPYALLMPVARPVYFELSAVTGTDDLFSANIASGVPVFDFPSLSQVHSLSAPAIIAESPVIGAATLAQIHALVASSLSPSAPILDSPSLSENLPNVDNLSAASIVIGVPEFGFPSIGQIHSMTATQVEAGIPSFVHPALSEIGPGVNALLVDNIVVGIPDIVSPSLQQIHALIVSDFVAGVSILGAPILHDGAIVEEDAVFFRVGGVSSLSFKSAVSLTTYFDSMSMLKKTFTSKIGVDVRKN